MPSWTAEQEKAISIRNTSVIVSAGAGSGKTAVLSERVLSKCLEGYHVNRMCLLTFTNAAAKEMKDRIYSKIKAQSIKNPQLASEIPLLDQAFITTFDSFSLSIVKKYHYLLGIPKEISIIDESLLKLEKEKILDEILDEEYQSKSPDFLKLISDYCLKDDKNIKDAIFIYEKGILLKPDVKKYLTEIINHTFEEDFIQGIIASFIREGAEFTEQIKPLFTIYYELMDGKIREKLDEVDFLFEDLSYQERKKFLDKISLPKNPNGSTQDIKNAKEEFSNALNELRENYYCYESVEQMENILRETTIYYRVFTRILMKLEDRIEKFEKNINAFDFQTVAKMAIELVKENKDVRKYYQNAFDEILIDEFQDTSDLQTELISYIDQNHTYVVGDIKQSIYRFRNANPYIFSDKYKKYQKNQGGVAIDLTKNFRSRKEVVDGINRIFGACMNPQFGGANYNLGHKMLYGNTLYDSLCSQEQSNNMEFWNTCMFENEDYSEDEKEAFIIARDIVDKVKSHYKVADLKNNKIRDIQYGDFAILVEKSQQFELTKKILEYYKIPSIIVKNEVLTKDTFIPLLKNILLLIQGISNQVWDTEMKYAYVSLSRSFLVQKPDAEIFEEITKEEIFSSDLYSSLKELALLYPYSSNEGMLLSIIDRFHVYENILSVGEVKDHQIRLEYFVNMAKKFDEYGKTIDEFVTYLKELTENEYEINYQIEQDASSFVKIMTIHKSKGLEFPICYFPFLNHEFSKKDLTARFAFDSENGMIAPYYKNAYINTPLKAIYNHKMLDELVSEKIRLLYVAATRAKEKMIFIGNFNPGTEMKNSVYSQRHVNSFAKLFSNYYPIIEKYTKILTENLELYTKEYLKSKINTLEFESRSNSFNMKSVLCCMEEYESDIHFSKNSVHLKTLEEQNSLELGTRLHEYLEGIDLHNLKNITGEYFEIIDKMKKCTVFSSIESANIYQEYHFIFQNKEGSIDLLLEFENEIRIIDYKTSNIDDPEYENQLLNYKKYISTITTKPIRLFLYSLYKGNYKEVLS